MTSIPPVINLKARLDEHEHLLRPPVNNRQVWAPMGDLIVQVVGGPNRRTDYHMDPYEEWFYQVRGDMHLNLMTEQGPQRVDIREGEMWMLPRETLHSPQRPTAGSIGLVVERIREEGTLEKFVWFCTNCHARVYEVELQVRDIVADLPPAFERFYNSENVRTCHTCGHVHPGKQDRP